jgi:hypothetical protein
MTKRHPLPKSLDDPSAAKPLRAAQAEPRMLVRVAVEVLLRTGLHVGEFTALAADAVVLIGAALATRPRQQSAPRGGMPSRLVSARSEPVVVVGSRTAPVVRAEQSQRVSAAGARS